MRDLEASLSFIQHLRVEHAHLNAALREARKVVFAPVTEFENRAEWQRAVAGMTGTLREHLVHHFAEEETGGCLEEAVCRCPGLAGEAELLEKEHSQLLARIDQLLTLTQRRLRGETGVRELQERFTEFDQALQAHEMREHHLLERGLAYASDDFDPLPAANLLTTSTPKAK